VQRADGVEVHLGLELRERFQHGRRLLEQPPSRGSAGEWIEQRRDAIAPILDQLPPVAFRNVKDAGTDICGYLTELFGFTVFSFEDGIVNQTYSTTGRGVEFLMPYYGFLNRALKGRDEDDGWQLWIRRHDEYDSE
jgi:predicted dithiol-disulfide oxidoreductase (DUF899 family)